MGETEEKAVPDESDDISLLDVAVVMAENLRLLIVVPLVVGTIALGLAYLITPQFTATVTILPPQQQQSTGMALAAQLGALSGLGGALGLRETSDLYVGMLKSRTLADVLVQRFKLRELYDQKYDEDARRVLEGQTRVSAGKEGLIDVEVTDESPQRAADIANAYVEELVKMTQNLAITEAQQRRVYFESQLKNVKDALTKAEAVLRGSGVSEATLKTIPESALAAIAQLSAQVTAQEIKLASMRTAVTSSNPEYRLALQQLAALKAELAKAEQSTVVEATAAGAEYSARFRDFKYQGTLYELLAKQYELARIDEGRNSVLIQVLDVAKPPERKSTPKKAQIAIATTLTIFFLMALFILVRRALRNAAKDPNVARQIESLARRLRIPSKWVRFQP